jgi:hypothetical protein
MDSTLLQHAAVPFVTLVIAAGGSVARLRSSAGAERVRLASRYAIVACGAVLGIMAGVLAYTAMN